MKLITVLTPSYNRAHTLNNLKESLLKQSNLNFNWILVNDGSTDETIDLVKGFDLPFDFEFISQENGGKHRAINHGMKRVKTPFVFIVDSDDTLTSDAIESASMWCNEIFDDNRFAGVSGNRGYQKTHEIIGQFPINSEVVDAKYSEREKHHIIGDKAEIYKTKLLLEYPFPEFDNENFLSENVVWDKLSSLGYLIRYHNKIIYLCEYLEDGLSKNIDEKIQSNFNGYILSEKTIFKTHSFLPKYLSLARSIEASKKKDLTSTEIKQVFEINEFQFQLGNLLSTVRRILKGR